jgi:3-dehydroquinate dehydratase II
VATMLILNGPNLNLLGQREPEVYGTTTLAEVEATCREEAGPLGVEIEFRQTNHEGELIDWLQEAGRRFASGDVTGVVLNPGAFTHTSIALQDAVKAADVPVAEVHISNVHARETYWHHSYVSAVAAGIVVGFGVHGYVLALQGLHHQSRSR